jgi:hypothetical protein
VPNTEKYFLHTSVFLRHASGASGEAEEQIEMILTKAVVTKHRVWMSSILFAELRPSVFIPGRFATLLELTHYFRSLATFVTPDPNIMLRAARLRDLKWQRPQEPMSLGDAIQIASALWVKEALGVRDLQFLLIDERRTDQARVGFCHSTVRLQDYMQTIRTPIRTRRRLGAPLRSLTPGADGAFARNSTTTEAS